MSDVPILLEMRSITKEFPGVKALSDVNLVVRAGEIHAICGENGAGKSTLMKVLSGVYPHGTYDGQIIYHGAEASFSDIRGQRERRHRDHPPGARAHSRACRSPRTSSSATSRASGARSTGRPRTGWRWTLMARVGLQEDPDTLIKDIGVGKQQLVEIAKAFAKDVKLLILDEPTAALNEADSGHLLDLLRGFRSRGITSIMISPQAERDRGDRRPDHHPARRPDRRDPRRQGRRRSTRTGSCGAWSAAS